MLENLEFVISSCFPLLFFLTFVQTFFFDWATVSEEMTCGASIILFFWSWTIVPVMDAVWTVVPFLDSSWTQRTSSLFSCLRDASLSFTSSLLSLLHLEENVLYRGNGGGLMQIAQAGVHVAWIACFLCRIQMFPRTVRKWGFRALALHSDAALLTKALLPCFF